MRRNGLIQVEEHGNQGDREDDFRLVGMVEQIHTVDSD